MDGAQLDVDGLETAEGPLHLGEALVGEDGVFGAERCEDDLSSSFSVARSSSSRLRLRSVARSGLRHMMSLSPG